MLGKGGISVLQTPIFCLKNKALLYLHEMKLVKFLSFILMNGKSQVPVTCEFPGFVFIAISSHLLQVRNQKRQIEKFALM